MISSSFKFLLLTTIVLALWASGAKASSGDPNDVIMHARHEQWMREHGRVYKSPLEKEYRFRIFKANMEFADSSNAVNHKYQLGGTRFADLTNREFRIRNGFKPKFNTEATSTFRYENNVVVPATMDWRIKGAVTPVKDQGACGCCWAFSAVAATEGIHKLSTGSLVSLSEQEVVSCDVKGEDEGCSGGLMDGAFEFIIKNKGLTTESNYPYQGVDGTCITNKTTTHVASITGYEDVPTNSEAALLKAVAMQPVSVAIDASSSAFQLYTGGVFTGACGTELDHGVTAVGYGVSGGTKYWLVKNSWGSDWGESGYIRMERDADAEEGLCGIAMQASYPTA